MSDTQTRLDAKRLAWIIEQSKGANDEVAVKREAKMPLEMLQAVEILAAELERVTAALREDRVIIVDLATALREAAESWPTPNHYSEMADAALVPPLDVAGGARAAQENQ
jgi:hypothetical protein